MELSDFEDIKYAEVEEKEEMLKEINRKLKQVRSSKRYKETKDDDYIKLSRRISASKCNYNNRVILNAYKDGLLIPKNDESKNIIESKIVKSLDDYKDIYDKKMEEKLFKSDEKDKYRSETSLIYLKNKIKKLEKKPKKRFKEKKGVIIISLLKKKNSGK